MADYIYLLENRLSPAQQRALGAIRTVVRSHDLTLFLTGGAVRDLTSGASVRDLDVTVQGDATALRGEIESAGGVFAGQNAPAKSLFFTFPGGIRMEVASSVAVTFPQPGRPEYTPAPIIEDLRSRDFTANAMALSLNEGSYGLLLDPLNGVADIENRELRLVSNYGFIEDPSRLIRAVRLQSRLGWQMEERTHSRYETAKQEGYISALSDWGRGYELEEIFHEEDPLRVMRALEADGWMEHLFPALSSAKANAAALSDLADKLGQLHTQGILANPSAITFPLLTAKLTEADAKNLKRLFARKGYVREIESLDERTRELQARFSGKEAALPSAAWRMLHEAEPEVVLSMAFGAKGSTVQGRLKTFLTDSPAARQRIPYLLMQEMRITPDLPVYNELLDKLFFALMDGKLETPEEVKAFLEPYSPPAPPPPVNLRRARAKKESKGRGGKAKKAQPEEPQPITPPEQELEEVVATSQEEVQGEQSAREKPIAKLVSAKPQPAHRAEVKKAEAKTVETAQKAKQPAQKPETPKKRLATENVPAKAPAVAKRAQASPAKASAPQKVAGKGIAPVAKKKPTGTQATRQTAAVAKNVPRKAAKSAPAKKAAAKPVAKNAATSVKKAAPSKQAPVKKSTARVPVKVPKKAAKAVSRKPAKLPAKKSAAARPSAKKAAAPARKPAPSPAKKAAKKAVRGR